MPRRMRRLPGLELSNPEPTFLLGPVQGGEGVGQSMEEKGRRETRSAARGAAQEPQAKYNLTLVVGGHVCGGPGDSSVLVQAGTLSPGRVGWGTRLRCLCFLVQPLPGSLWSLLVNIPLGC